MDSATDRGTVHVTSTRSDVRAPASDPANSEIGNLELVKNKSMAPVQGRNQLR
jgi:hypothetical protein